MLKSGRPVKFNKAMAEKALDYIERHEEFGDPIPSVAGLACVLGTTRKTIHEWVRRGDVPGIGHILEILLQKQERRLLSGGLLGNFNSAVTKMILTKHGYSDRVESDVTSSDGSARPAQIILRVAGES